MSKINKKVDKINQETFNKMAASITNYLRLRGWIIFVLGSPKVLKEIGSLKYNYIFEVEFTGKRMKNGKSKNE